MAEIDRKGLEALSDTRFRALADHVPAMLWMTDRTGRCTYFNRRWLEVTARTLEQELGGGWLDGIHPEDRERCGTAFADHLSVPQRFVLDYRLLCADASYRWVRSEGRPWYEPDGQFGGYVGTCTDISAERAGNDALREAHAQLQGLVETSGALIFLIDDEGRYRLVNRGWQRICNPRGMPVIGMKVTDFLPPEAAEKSMADNRAVLERGETVQGEMHIDLNGETRVYLVNKVPIRLLGGPPIAVCGIAVDITDRRHAEDALRASERELQDILDHSPALVFVLDRSNRYRIVNKRWEQVFGQGRANVSGHSMQEVFPPDVALQMEDANDQVWRTGEPLQVENQIVVDGQPRTFRSLKFLLRDTQGVPYALCGISGDVTDRLRIEEERRRIDQQIQHAQKLESLGVLAGGIAHDFNNLLVGVLGNAGLALMDLPASSPASAAVRNIETAALRAAELTRQMLAYSGKGRFLVQRIHLSHVVEETAELLRTVISKRAVLRFDLAQALPSVEADPTQVRQVVMNLITNASDAIADRSGFITVRTGVMQASSEYLHDLEITEELPAGPYAYVEVADTGVGMDAETRRRIFDPFFSTKFTGRGLGLAAVLGIVRGHAGTIKIYTEPGRGSVFRVLFPCTDGPAVVQDSRGPASAEWRGDGLVLVVDDDENVRLVSKLALERHGFTVELAPDGRSAIEQFRVRPEAYAAVLLDLTMPHMGGEATFRAMREIHPGVRVLLMSGYNSQELTSEFAGRGLAGFVQKPFQVSELLAAMRAVVDPGPTGS